MLVKTAIGKMYVSVWLFDKIFVSKDIAQLLFIPVSFNVSLINLSMVKMDEFMPITLKKDETTLLVILSNLYFPFALI